MVQVPLRLLPEVGDLFELACLGGAISDQEVMSLRVGSEPALRAVMGGDALMSVDQAMRLHRDLAVLVRRVRRRRDEAGGQMTWGEPSEPYEWDQHLRVTEVEIRRWMAALVVGILADPTVTAGGDAALLAMWTRLQDHARPLPREGRPPKSRRPRRRKK